jgi:hypothetical protein
VRSSLNTGIGRVLIFVYGVFALSATARATVQIVTKFSEAPLAFSLSALAAVIYIVATVGLVLGDRRGRRIALVCCTVELIGVLGIGALSVAVPDDFPHPTVWSNFGQGYGYVPLVLPILGLWWILRGSRERATP